MKRGNFKSKTGLQLDFVIVDLGIAENGVNGIAANSWIEPEYRRQGIATFMYNKLEEVLNINIQPSETLSNDAKRFWMNRLS